MKVILKKSFKKETGQELSENEKDALKQIIVQEHIEKVSWSKFKKKLGVKDEDFKNLTQIKENSLNQNEKNLPLSLVLVQVADDVNGGTGIDGAGEYYSVNGDNDLISVSVDSRYDGKDLYDCLFEDEDAPTEALDISYDAVRMSLYGTLNDLQGFFIYEPDDYNHRYIEFGNDYDNGHAYATTVGQHGQLKTVWHVGDEISISNVWNHAMSLEDRNPNMDQLIYNFN